MAADQIHIEPAYRQLLAAHGLTSVAAVMAADAGRPSSRHRTRNTAPLVLDDAGRPRHFYLKRVFRVPILHTVADLLRGRVPRTQPQREFLAAERLRERGIGVMRAVAWGQRTWLGLPRQAFVLVEAVPTPDTVLTALAASLSPRTSDSRMSARTRHTLARELGAFVRRLHDGRFAYPDLVGKHIYVAPAGPDAEGARWQFYLIDVERLASTHDPRVHPRELRHLLASLAPLPLAGTDLLRFAAGYAGATSGPWAARRAALCRVFGWAGRLLPEAVRRAARRPRLPDDFAERLNERFIPHERFTLNERYITALQQLGLGTFRAVFRYATSDELHKAGLPSWRSRTRIRLTDSPGLADTLYLKRYDHPPLGVQLRRFLSPARFRSTAGWEWRQIQKLHRLGVPTVFPVAFGEKRRGLFERRSFLLTEGVPGESLERWVPEHCPPVTSPLRDRPDHRHRRHSILRELAHLTATLHGAGLVHRDLYLSHVFVSFSASGHAHLRLIDLARVFQPVRVRLRRWIVKDLAALNVSSPPGRVSRSDRVRFLRAYLDLARLDESAKTLARRVAARTCRIQRRVNAAAVPTAGAPAAEATSVS